MGEWSAEVCSGERGGAKSGGGATAWSSVCALGGAPTFKLWTHPNLEERAFRAQELAGVEHYALRVRSRVVSRRRARRAIDRRRLKFRRLDRLGGADL